MKKSDIIKILNEKTQYDVDVHGYPYISQLHIEDIADEILKLDQKIIETESKGLEIGR